MPKWQTTLTADYNFPLVRDFEGYVGANYTYTGNRRGNFNFRPSLSYLLIPSFDTFGLQAGVRNARFGIQVYGKNLGDERGVTNYFGGRTLALPPVFGIPPIPLPATANLIRPREIGIRFTGSF